MFGIPLQLPRMGYVCVSISCLGETNGALFDHPEAKAESVAGYDKEICAGCNR